MDENGQCITETLPDVELEVGGWVSRGSVYGWVGGWDDDSKWCGCQWVGAGRCRCGSCMLECNSFTERGGVGPAAARHHQPIASWLLRLEKWPCLLCVCAGADGCRVMVVGMAN